MDILSTFSDDVLEIDISKKDIVGALDFDRFTNLIKLNCKDNQITELNNLPDSLQILICFKNNITKLDNLPKNLIKLDCGDNQISSLDNLPKTLQKL